MDQSQVDALDDGASLMIKATRYKDALRGARRMCELDPSNPKGYLRSAQCLLLVGNVLLAQQMYEAGLQHASPTHPQYQTLLTLRGKNAQRLGRKHTVDLVIRLPMELLLQVMDYLSVTEKVACASVSTTWRTILYTNPLVWSRLDLRSVRRLDNRLFSLLVSKAGKKLRAVHLATGQDVTATRFKSLVTHKCFKLRVLEMGHMNRPGIATVGSVLFYCGYQLRVLSIALNTPLTTLCEVVLKYCPNLQRLRIDVCSYGHNTTSTALFLEGLKCIDTLEHVEWDDPWGLVDTNTFTFLFTFLIACKRLKRLKFKATVGLNEDVQGWMHQLMPRLTHLGMCCHDKPLEAAVNLAEGAFSKHPLPLVSLVLSRSRCNPVETMFFRLTPSLRHVDFSFTHGITNGNIVQLANHCPLLEYVDLSGIPHLTAASITHLVQQLVHVHTLKLASLHCMSDAVVECIVDTFHMLTMCDLSNTLVSGLSIVKLAGMQRMRHLDVRNCNNVQRDTIDWIRTNHFRVTVYYGFSQTS